MDKKLDRKLAAILYADVAAYSRLTGEDEEGTHRRLSHCLDLIAETINNHDGNVVHYAGDAVLADFTTVSNGLACAVDIQRRLREQNTDLPEDRRVEFRIGLNLGEVIVDRGDIYGDGVNVAARLESLADPGGICISESVRTAIGKKLDLGYEFMGEQQVKNIEEPVRAYKVTLAAEEKTQATSPTKPTLELPDKPSIAVLPFTNMSGDPEQEYFSDGITEDIITALSRISGLLVVARHSTLIYKGQTVDIKQVGREQGVAYVLEGSVRKSGNRVRVTAQLIDVTTGHHRWAERYDRELDDIFAVQDDITHNVTIALQVELTQGEQARVMASGTDSVKAWELVVRADELMDRHIREDKLEGKRLAEAALQIDPAYALAWIDIGWSHWEDAYWGWSESSEESVERALDAAQKALEIDDTHPDALALLSATHSIRGEHDKAIVVAEKAVSLAPSHAEATAILAMALMMSVNPTDAIHQIKRAMRLCPVYPAWYLLLLGQCQYQIGENDQAISTLREAVEREPDSALTMVWLANVLAEVGSVEEAKSVVERILTIDPTFTLTRGALGLSLTKDPALNKRVLENLRKAGLPE